MWHLRRGLPPVLDATEGTERLHSSNGHGGGHMYNGTPLALKRLTIFGIFSVHKRKFPIKETPSKYGNTFHI